MYRVLFVAVVLSAAGCGSSANVPPYGISFYFEHSSFPSADLRAFQENEPITAHAYSWKFDKIADLPDMRPILGTDGATWRHWLTLIVQDQDDLAYRWQRVLSHDEYLKERQQWQAADRGHHFAFDVQNWVPKGFRWKAGWYRVSGLATASGKEFAVTGQPFFMIQVPDSFAKRAPSQPAVDLRQRLLKLELQANKKSFRPGELIVFEGYVRNDSHQAFMLQTHEPFLEARLLASPGDDPFPQPPPTRSIVRLAHFRRIEPGERILFFQETFVAGRTDPHWATGNRNESFPPPFAGATKRDVRFELSSSGLFPQDRQPDVGIWTGTAESNRVAVRID